MSATMIFAAPKRFMTLKLAKSIAGSLGKPSKMPGLSYGISAELCNVGAKLAAIVGSVCHGCYAMKANYKYPSVKTAHANRAAGLSSVSWADAMIKQIGHSKTDYFRWHDAGDIQSFQHLLDIVRIAEALPTVAFWIPTRESGLIKRFAECFGAFPDNLCVRVSAAMIDGKPPAGFENTSTVHAAKPVQGFACPAPAQGNRCGECRACWDKGNTNTSYHVH
jgi:hypothetical protein